MRKISLLLVFLSLFAGCHSKSHWVEVFLSKGESYLREGKYEKSLEEFLKAQRLAPANQRIYENMAEAHLKLKKYGPALESLNRLIQLNPDIKAQIYFTRGEIVAADPVHTREAIRLGYNPAIEKDPNQGIYFYKRAIAYQKLGETDRAQTDFAEARRLAYVEGRSG